VRCVGFRDDQHGSLGIDEILGAQDDLKSAEAKRARCRVDAQQEQ
jgi:hypothetical protein